MSNNAPFEQPQIVEDRFETPEFLYLNIPQQFLGIWATLPLQSKLSATALGGIGLMTIKSIEAEEDLQIKFRNVSGRKKFAEPKTPQEFINILKTGNTIVQKAIPTIQYVIDLCAIKNKLHELTSEVLYQLLVAILKTNGIEESFIGDLEKRLKGHLMTTQETDEVEIESITYQGKTFTPQEFEIEQQALLEKMNQVPATVTKGSYLYRMPRSNEFKEMRQNKGMWLMPLRTNFVDEKAYTSGPSFIDIFQDEDDYAGVSIRLQVKFQGFQYRFMSGVVESFTPMFVETEYLDTETGEWKKFD